MLVLALLALGLAYVGFWLLPDVFEPWNARATDQLFRWRSGSVSLRPVYDPTIVHVDISNSTIQRFDQFHLTRAHFAQVVRNLAAMGVAAQLYDYIFSAASHQVDDEFLIAATQAAPRVYYGMAFEWLQGTPPPQARSMSPERSAYLTHSRWHVAAHNGDALLHADWPFTTFPALSYASHGLGFLNAVPDRDGVFRRMALLVRYGDAFYPSLALRVICDYLSVPPEQLVLLADRLILRGARRPGQDVGHDIVIPIDARGNMLVNFVGAWERMTHYDFADILQASTQRVLLDIWREELHGKIVVVSESATGVSDIGPVPVDTHFPLSGLLANVMHTILTEQFLRELPAGEMVLIELGLLAIVFFLACRVASLWFALGTLAVMLTYAGAAVLAFFYGHVLVNIIRPELMLGIALVGVVTYRYVNEEKERAVLRRLFEAYFPPTVIDRIMRNPALVVASTGQRKELTIMFTDIAGFSTYAATREPAHIQALLNEYFEAMIDIVFHYGGTIEKFTGDGFLVFFGDPEPQSDHALRCVRAAIDMQRKARQLKAVWQAQDKMPLQIRIGINTGPVIVGNMGSARRLTYTVIGSDANLAQRMEANAPVGGILLTKATYEQVRASIPACPQGMIDVKGFDQPIEVYTVVIPDEADEKR
jgi:adenylate cyclase